MRSLRLAGRSLLLVAVVAMLAWPCFAADWPQFGFDPQHSGNNPSETVINASNVGQLARLFQVTLPD
ncbi:MAG: hypothetical protein DLM69_10230, partial [Candidatus Chloroheliales bacterium]